MKRVIGFKAAASVLFVSALALLCASCSSQGIRRTGLTVLRASVPVVPAAAQRQQSAALPRRAAQAGSVPMVLVDDKLTPEQCLACHGDFKDIAAKSEEYVNEFGEKVNPHRYVPHDSTKLPECLSCHKQHEIPPKGKVEQTDMTMDYCYSCHHTQTFEKCTDCHQE